MSNNNNQPTTVSLNVAGLLGVAFVILKLCGVIDWSWWLVTLPFWGGLAIALVIFVILLVIAAFRDP